VLVDSPFYQRNKANAEDCITRSIGQSLGQSQECQTEIININICKDTRWIILLYLANNCRVTKAVQVVILKITFFVIYSRES
jgi:hypothetical protein